MSVVTCPTCGEIIGGKREASTVDRREALGAWQGLSETAREVVWFLYRHRLASHWQIGDAIYLDSNAGNRKNRAKNVLHRLQKLGLVQRLDGGKKHHGRAFFSLSDAGIFCCQAEAKAGGRNVKKLKSLKPHELLDSPAWRHHYFLTDVMASFINAERRGLGELIDYHGDGEMDYRFVAASIGTKHLRPDATVLWSDGQRPYLCWLELEHRHATLDDAAEKIKKYVLFSRAGSQPGNTYKRLTGQNQFPVLLVIAVKASQLSGLRQSIIRGVLAGCGGETLPEVSKRVVVGLVALDDIREHGVLGPCWEAVIQARGLVRFEELFGLIN